MECTMWVCLATWSALCRRPCTMYFANITRCRENSVARNDNACTAFSLYVAANCGLNVTLGCPAITAMSNQQSETIQWLVGACLFTTNVRRR